MLSNYLVRFGAEKPPLPDGAPSVRRALFFLLLNLPTLGAKPVPAGFLAPARFDDWGDLGSNPPSGPTDLRGFFLIGVTTPSGRSLTGFEGDVGLSNRLGRALARSGLGESFGAPMG